MGRVDLRKYCEICDTLIGAKSNRKKYCNECADNIKKKADGGVVYLITNNINNKKYVGITTSINGFKDRYRSGIGNGIERVYNHLNYHKQYGDYYNVHLFRSIEKYGFENFTVNEEFEKASSKKELLEREIYWIKYFNSNTAEFGYNITGGGEGGLEWSKNKHTLKKFKTSKAKTFNEKLDKWFNERQNWDEKFLGIWDINDGLDIERKRILFHMLIGGEIKDCLFCGVKIKKYGADCCHTCEGIKANEKRKPIPNKNKTYENTVSKRLMIEMEINKCSIIEMYIKDKLSFSRIASLLNVNGLRGIMIKNFLINNDIKLRRTK